MAIAQQETPSVSFPNHHARRQRQQEATPPLSNVCHQCFVWPHVIRGIFLKVYFEVYPHLAELDGLVVQLVYQRHNNQEDYLDAKRRRRAHDLYLDDTEDRGVRTFFSIKVFLLVVVSLDWMILHIVDATTCFSINVILLVVSLVDQLDHNPSSSAR